MGTDVPSGNVALAGPALSFTSCCALASPAPSRRTAAPRIAALRIAFILFTRISVLLAQFDSSITNSRESTSIIIIIPPGKMLLVVISRSLCECHINAKPASLLGSLAIVPDGGVVPLVPQLAAFEPGHLPNVARLVASGPKYGLPPYHAPLTTMFGLG